MTFLEAAFIVRHPRDRKGRLIPYGAPRSHQQKPAPEGEAAARLYWRQRGLPDHRIDTLLAEDRQAQEARLKQMRAEFEERRRRAEAHRG